MGEVTQPTRAAPRQRSGDTCRGSWPEALQLWGLRGDTQRLHYAERHGSLLKILFPTSSTYSLMLIQKTWSLSTVKILDVKRGFLREGKSNIECYGLIEWPHLPPTSSIYEWGTPGWWFSNVSMYPNHVEDLGLNFSVTHWVLWGEALESLFLTNSLGMQMLWARDHTWL